MSEEKTTKYDKLEELCDHLVDTIGNSSDENHVRIIDTAFDIFKEHEDKYYKDLEHTICYQCKKEITEDDEEVIIEAGTASVFCCPACYATHAKEVY